MFGVDRENRSPKGMTDQVPEERPPDAASFFRGPDNRDTLWLENDIEGMALLVAKNRGSSNAA